MIEIAGGLEKQRIAKLRIADVGTGSGAIAVALASKLLGRGADTRDGNFRGGAGSCARECGTERRRESLAFHEGDLLAPVAGELFDFIVSNPPYVPEPDRDSLSVEVRDYEPAQALFAGDDGLDVYRRLIPAAFTALPGGYVALEIGFGQQAAVGELLAEARFEDIEFTKDLQGIARVAVARRP